MKKYLKVLSAVLLASFAFAGSALAAWPEKTIEFVVPYKAGGDTDFHTRTLAKYLEPILGQKIIVTNMEGASGSAGMI